MKQILVFGAGKSATILIEYLVRQCETENWKLIVADADQAAAERKVGGSSHASGVGLDIHHADERNQYIEKADVVISLLPPALHKLVAMDCLRLGKHLLTASYVDDDMRSIKNEVAAKDLLFLCEMGLDPGIDHMSAKKMIDDILEEDASIISFYSHCGGLVAPESDDNPWHYKISWNPRNVVNAGKAGAIFKQDGEIREMEYPELFAEKRYVSIPGHEVLCWYPNRDSLSYIPVYGLEKCGTFIRTTLRHPDFMYGWKNLIELNLTDDKKSFETKDLSLMNFFKQHMDRNGFSDWLEQKLGEQFNSTKTLLAELVNLVELEQKAAEKGIEQVDEFMVVDDQGDLKKIDIDDLKVNAAATLADKMHDASLTLKQLFYLGLDDDKTVIPFDSGTAADVLLFALERKLALKKEDQDMIIMLHEIEFIKDDQRYKSTSTLIVKGQDDQHTAMAKTVGMPLAIAACLLLKGELNVRGLHIPVSPEIYLPVLKKLEEEGIVFHEEILPC